MLLEQGLLEYVRVNSRLKDDVSFKTALAVIRAYLGDVVISTNGVDFLHPCSNESIETLKVVCKELKGASGSVMRVCSIGPENKTKYVEDISHLQSNNCWEYDHTGNISQYTNMVQDIYARIRAGQDLTANEIDFVRTSVFPIYTYLSWIGRAEELGYTSPGKIESVSKTLALAIYIDAFYYRLSIALGSVSSAVSSILKACSNAQKDASDAICGKKSILEDYLDRLRKLRRVVSDSRSKIYKTFESDFEKLRKDYENSWRFVMNTLRTYGLEKSYNFSASAE